MGALMGMTIPAMMGRFVDHTYVQCGTGKKAWGCYGRKTGGTECVRGIGSTMRADAIAGANEQAGLRFYGVNGVCHQMANRILLPATRLVRAARGYSISAMLYGPYGRPMIGTPWASPFHQHANISGDAADCIASQATAVGKADQGIFDFDPAEPLYIRSALVLYSFYESFSAWNQHPKILEGGPESRESQSLIGFQLQLFELWIDYNIRSPLSEKAHKRLLGLREKIEISRIDAEFQFFKNKMTGQDFIENFNEITLEFQQKAAEILDSKRYRQLFHLEPHESLLVLDPDISENVFLR